MPEKRESKLGYFTIAQDDPNTWSILEWLIFNAKYSFSHTIDDKISVSYLSVDELPEDLRPSSYDSDNHWSPMAI